MPIHTLLKKMYVCVSLEAYHIYVHMLCLHGYHYQTTLFSNWDL